jgi:hypothetical protein
VAFAVGELTVTMGGSVMGVFREVMSIQLALAPSRTRNAAAREMKHSATINAVRGRLVRVDFMNIYNRGIF